MTKPSIKRTNWVAQRAARKAEQDRIYRIHEAERRVIEAAHLFRLGLVGKTEIFEAVDVLTRETEKP